MESGEPPDKRRLLRRNAGRMTKVTAATQLLGQMLIWELEGAGPVGLMGALHQKEAVVTGGDNEKIRDGTMRA